MENSQLETQSVFEQQKHLLRAMPLDLSTAEIHGLVTGVVCAGLRCNGRHWIDSLLGSLCPKHRDQAKSREVLLNLYALISEQFTLGTQFQLLLPPTTHCHLTERAQALSDWCAGFLGGLRFGGVLDVTHFANDTGDALYHCTEIAKLDYDNVDCSDADLTAFEQVSEYVRSVVMLIHSEFNGLSTVSHARRLEQVRPFRSTEETVH